jgi:tRNA nucleotidyltransferase (CCA-adding enzyme)
MKAYIVGGWVRDRLLEQEGRTVARASDRDWVVVGSDPQEMIALGYRPVGRDFPVFLHPRTHEEYALARTERKTGPGYRGFVVHAAPDVTLEQDLQRRDLTINAMAQDEEGRLIDPTGGRQDLRGRVLRHVGPAFVEDPVRILRLARFAARFPEFSVAPQTLALAQGMVAGGEADALVAERVWQELARGLMEERPSRMLEVLDATGLLARIAPGRAPGPGPVAALDRAAAAGAPLDVRAAIFWAGAPDAAPAASGLEDLRADGDSVQLARLLQQLHGALRSSATAAQRLAVLERADAFRRAARFERLLQACEILDGAGSADAWRRAARAAAGVDAGAVARAAGPSPEAIASAIAQARREAIERAPGAGPAPPAT